MLAPQSWLTRTWAGLPLRRWTLICGNRLWAGLPWMIIANGWVKSVVEPLTMGKRAGAVAGESAVSTILCSPDTRLRGLTSRLLAAGPGR
jgi:hypothetical protein